MDIVRTAKLIRASLAVICLGLTLLAGAAFAGNLDALLGDWDLNDCEIQIRTQAPHEEIHHEGDRRGS